MKDEVLNASVFQIMNVDDDCNFIYYLLTNVIVQARNNHNTVVWRELEAQENDVMCWWQIVKLLSTKWTYSADCCSWESKMQCLISTLQMRIKLTHAFSWAMNEEECYNKNKAIKIDDSDV